MPESSSGDALRSIGMTRLAKLMDLVHGPKEDAAKKQEAARKAPVPMPKAPAKSATKKLSK